MCRRAQCAPTSAGACMHERESARAHTLTHTHQSTSPPFDAQALQYQQTTIAEYVGKCTRARRWWCRRRTRARRRRTPNITPTLVQRAGMPRFLRKPLSGEQGGSITSLPPPPPHTKAHASRAHMHTYKRTHTHMRIEGRGHAKGASPPPHTHTQML